MNKPFHNTHGDRICIKGWLWELTYSEMAPPDSRQRTGIRCPTCAAEEPETPDGLPQDFGAGEI